MLEFFSAKFEFRPLYAGQKSWLKSGFEKYSMYTSYKKNFRSNRHLVLEHHTIELCIFSGGFESDPFATP